ncbi:hypothetical protein GCM10020000_77340 [Streptomyces olivoverticillatus]
MESGSELRWDPTTEEWVVMAAHRKARTADTTAQCPLCPSSDAAATEIPLPATTTSRCSKTATRRCAERAATRTRAAPP